MPVVPPVFIQATSAFSGGAFVPFVHSLAYSSNVTIGSLLFVFIYGQVPTINGGSPTGSTLSLTSLGDTQGNIWHDLGIQTAMLSTGVGIGQFASQYYFGIQYAYANATGPCTVNASWNCSGGFTSSVRLNLGEWKNVGVFDRFLGGFSTSNPAVFPTPLVSTENNEFYIGATGYGILGPSFTPGIWTGGPWIQRGGSGSPTVGPMWEAMIGPTGVDPTPTFTANNSLNGNYWSGVTVFKSTAPVDPPFGNSYLVQYPAVTWMKNLCTLAQRYWDPALGSPYVGQLYPVLTPTAPLVDSRIGDPNSNVFLSQNMSILGMNNVLVLAKSYWDKELSTPYFGQTSPVVNPGGAPSGRTHPF